MGIGFIMPPYSVYYTLLLYVGNSSGQAAQVALGVKNQPASRLQMQET